MTDAPLILITRPEAEAAAYALELEEHGLRTLCDPMLGIVPVRFKVPKPQLYQGFIFTSARAAEIFGLCAGCEKTPVFAVGEATQKAAIDQGYEFVLSAQGGGPELADLIRKTVQPGGRPLLYVRGEDVARPLDELLQGSRIALETLVVYRAEPAQELSPESAAALGAGAVAGVTFFSRRTAKNFMKKAAESGLLPALKSIKALCLSDEVLECVQPEVWAGAYVAGSPDRAAMTSLALRVCR